MCVQSIQTQKATQKPEQVFSLQIAMEKVRKQCVEASVCELPKPLKVAANTWA